MDADFILGGSMLHAFPHVNRRPILPPLRDGATVGEAPQPDQLAGTIHPFLSMQIIPGCLSIVA